MAAASAIITAIDQSIEEQLGSRTHAQLRAILEDARDDHHPNPTYTPCRIAPAATTAPKQLDHPHARAVPRPTAGTGRRDWSAATLLHPRRTSHHARAVACKSQNTSRDNTVSAPVTEHSAHGRAMLLHS